MKRPHLTFVPFLSTVALLVAAPVGARQVGTSPHGTLPEDLDCSACHTSDGWTTLREPLGFDHDARTGFTLTGAHVDVPCVGCHEELRFAGVEFDAAGCAGCHRDVHEGQMVRDCEDCHSTRSFREVDGEAAHARTTFPLLGAHRQVTCESCHLDDVGGSFVPLDPECVSCHDDDFHGALTVDHAAAGYSTECRDCHSPVAWSDAPRFDHVQVAFGFALEGAHAALRCGSCHRVPGMEPFFQPAGQEDCVACHQADYDSEHQGWGVPPICTDCHTVEAWSPSTFDHDGRFFPIFSGRHAQEWTDCGDCHINPVQASEVTCLACHEHRQEKMDDVHSGEPGYVYTTTACLDCHPGGQS